MSYDNDELQEGQRNDSAILSCIKFLETGDGSVNYTVYKKHKSKFVLHNNILFYNLHEKYLYVCPKEMRQEFIQLAHDQFYSGHFGIQKTYRKLLDSVWWPAMQQDVQEYIKNCKVCILSTHGKKTSILGRREFPSRPNQLVSIDFIVNLPTTSRRNVHILTIVDNFTKYIRCYAVKDRINR